MFRERWSFLWVHDERSYQPVYSLSVEDTQGDLPSATALVKQLHWLPVHWRIRFKLATMTFRALRTSRPPYLTDQLQYYQPTRSLHSWGSGSHQLVKPRHNLSFGSRAFCVSAPHIWNALPSNIREAQSVLTFRRHLLISKRTAFSQPFPPPTNPPANVPWFFLRYWHYVNHLTYLLTCVWGCMSWDFIAFHVSRRWREMYIGHAHLSVCPLLHSHTTGQNQMQVGR